MIKYYGTVPCQVLVVRKINYVLNNSLVHTNAACIYLINYIKTVLRHDDPSEIIQKNKKSHAFPLKDSLLRQNVKLHQ